MVWGGWRFGCLEVLWVGGLEGLLVGCLEVLWVGGLEGLLVGGLEVLGFGWFGSRHPHV